jgi:hypothetical protein
MHGYDVIDKQTMYNKVSAGKTYKQVVSEMGMGSVRTVKRVVSKSAMASRCKTRSLDLRQDQSLCCILRL